MKLAVLGLLVVFTFAGCYLLRPDRVDVLVTNKTPSQIDVDMTSGGEGKDLKIILPYQSDSAMLFAGSGSQPQLHLFYEESNIRKYWLGPDYPDGKGFKIQIEIYPENRLRYRSCLRPCDVDDEAWKEDQSKLN